LSSRARFRSRGDVVLEKWIVSKSEVCEREDMVDGKRIYFDVWVQPKPK
jgi:hypothetical protein